MKYFYTAMILIALCLAFVLPAVAQTAYTYSNEGFEQTSLWPTSASTTEKSVTASTGTWKFKSAFQKGSYAHSGTYELSINSSGYLITPQLSTGAGTLTFYARSTSTTARTLTIQKSTDGTTFTTVTTMATGGSTYKLMSIAINDVATRYVKIVEPTSGGAYYDDLVITSGGGTTVPVTGVSVAPTSASMAIGGTTQLTATVSPSNATNKNVTWSSSNTAVATVSASGLVTGVTAGNATVTVRTSDGGFTATSAITVTSTNVPVTGVSVAPTSASVNPGSTVQLTATVTPSNATNKSVTWSSSNTAAATVSANGLVTGVAAGSATITVRTADGGFTATSAITVSSTTVPVTGVSVAPTSASTTVGGTTQLTATVSPSNATNKNVTWSSSNTAIATVSASGLVTGVATGSATITVRTADGGFTATSSITITAPPTGAYYVATNGSDSNPGTISAPFKTIPKAISLVVAGDIIYVRGGTYSIQYKIIIPNTKCGTSTKEIGLFAYPGEKPILDFSSMIVADSNQGIYLTANYWHIKGLDIKGAGDNGMLIEDLSNTGYGRYNIIENCNIYENRDAGLQLKRYAAYNKIMNCDSYYNMDPGEGNADGFSPKLTVGTGNYFYGCRAWQNSDDGWDCYLKPEGVDNVVTTIENCWCFKNGYRKDGSASSGNGNGFKMGSSDLHHDVILKNCLAFQNRKKGYDQNHNQGSMTLWNCTAWSNGTNFAITEAVSSGKTVEVTNGVSAGTGKVDLGSFVVQRTDSWQTPFVVTDADFVSVNPAAAFGPRKADGSLPTITFMHLAAGSDLIDGGTNVGLPYVGSKPDLGCFEYGSSAKQIADVSMPKKFELMQNYPNPFNPSTTISFSLAQAGHVSLKVYDLLGREVATLVDGYREAGMQTPVVFDASKIASGMYLYRLQAGSNILVKKLMLVK